MPLFMNAHAHYEQAEEKALDSPQSTNRPSCADAVITEVAREQAGCDNRIDESPVVKSPVDEEDLFAGLDFANMAAHVAKQFILTNAMESVHAQATLLDWRSLRLLR